MHGFSIHGSRCNHQVTECRKKGESEEGLNPGVAQYLQVGEMKRKQQRRRRCNERKPEKYSDLDSK